MRSHRLLSLTLMTGALIIGFQNPANAKTKHRRHCRQVVQVVKIGGVFKLKEYGTACHKGYDKGWQVVSKHKHPSRVGDKLYMWDHGRLVNFYGHNKKWDPYHGTPYHDHRYCGKWY